MFDVDVSEVFSGEWLLLRWATGVGEDPVPGPSDPEPPAGAQACIRQAPESPCEEGLMRRGHPPEALWHHRLGPLGGTRAGQDHELLVGGVEGVGGDATTKKGEGA